MTQHVPEADRTLWSFIRLMPDITKFTKHGFELFIESNILDDVIEAKMQRKINKPGYAFQLETIKLPKRRSTAGTIINETEGISLEQIKTLLNKYHGEQLENYIKIFLYVIEYQSFANWWNAQTDALDRFERDDIRIQLGLHRLNPILHTRKAWSDEQVTEWLKKAFEASECEDFKDAAEKGVRIENMYKLPVQGNIEVVMPRPDEDPIDGFLLPGYRHATLGEYLPAIEASRIQDLSQRRPGSDKDDTYRTVCLGTNIYSDVWGTEPYNLAIVYKNNTSKLTINGKRTKYMGTFFFPQVKEEINKKTS